MPKALVKTRKVGGSMMVRIPKDVVELEGIKEGELVELEVQKARKDWFGAFPKLKPFSRDEELDSTGALP
jgi:antitoxin component of MazEF toxin-antitoxin module